MGLRQHLQDLTVSPQAQDERRLREFCTHHPGVVPIGDVAARQAATVVAEVASVRLVPKGGTSWLEVTVSDGTDRMVIMWTGRRRLPGVEPGRRLVFSGTASAIGPGGRMLMMNPRYELL